MIPVEKLRLDGTKLKDRRGEQRVTCPKCQGGNGKERSLAVQIRADSIIWNYHRATCGWKGAFFDEANTGSHGLRRHTRDQRADPYENARHRWRKISGRAGLHGRF
jgi:hypothetical protein